MVLHEPPGTQALHDAITQAKREDWPFTAEQIWGACRREGVDRVLAAGKHYIETTPILAPLTGYLASAYPTLKLGWLYRDDPRFWVRSAMHIGFQLCRHDKVCEYWNLENQTILDNYFQAPRKRRCMIRTSQLNDSDFLMRLYRWFGLEPLNDDVTNILRAPWIGHKYEGPLWFPHPDDWTSGIKGPYDKYVLPLFDKMEGMYEKEQLKF